MQNMTKTRLWARAAMMLLAAILSQLPISAQTTLQGDGSAGNPYSIATDDDWKAFAKLVSDGSTTACAKMTADVNLGEGLYAGMIGTDTNPYSGTFDGDGHTLTVTYHANQPNVAPFRWIAGATIKNLHTAGTFTVSNKFVAGIVARVKTSASILENCGSSVVIESSLSGDGTYGGLVANADAQIAIKNCVFNGSIIGSKLTNCGGIIGWAEVSGTTLTNCLVAATFDLSSSNGSSYTFARNADKVTVTSGYYLNALGAVNAGGTQVTARQVASGETAWTLQSLCGSTQVWGQGLPDSIDATPIPTADAAKRVYKVTYYAKDGTTALETQYANPSGVDSIPAVIAAANPQLNGVAFTKDTQLTGDVSVTLANDIARGTLNVTIDTVLLVPGVSATPVISGLPDDYTGTVTYTSTDASIVSVDGSALKGVSAGTTTVTATFSSTTLYSELTKPFAVQVNSKAYGVKVNGTDIGTGKADGWYFANNTLNITGNSAVTLSGTNTTDKIKVSVDADVDLTLDNLTLTHNGFGIASGHTVNLYLKGTNTLTGSATDMSAQSPSYAGFSVPSGAAVVIDAAEGAKTAVANFIGGRYYAAGLGSDYHGYGLNTGSSGTIIINGGTVNATGGRNAAGIGGCSNGACGVVIINGGNVYARYSQTGADIGSGNSVRGSEQATVVITGGSVNATSFNCKSLTNGTDNGAQPLYKVTVPGLVKNGTIDLDSIPSYYSLAGATADSEGKAYIWLPAADYTFCRGLKLYGANVVDAAVTATEKGIIVDENDDNVFSNSENQEVLLRRTFAADTWNTFVVPFALTTDEVKAAFGEAADVAYFTNETENTIELNTKDETKAIEPNTPVLLRVKAEVVNPVFTARNIVSAEAAKVSGTKGIDFIGTYAKSYTIADGQYFISGDKLWKSQGSSTLKATRAYFTVPESINEAKVAFLINGDTVTGIDGVFNKAHVSQAVYNLRGQKVADSLSSGRLVKGVYIVGGKKVVVR